MTTYENALAKVWILGRAFDRVIYAQIGDTPSVDDDMHIGVFNTVELAKHVVLLHNMWLDNNK